MKGIILAAGVSSRMRPLTNNTPKCLLAIGEQTILQRTINNLISNDISEIIIVTGYLEDQIHNFIQNNYPDLKIQFIHNSIYDSTNNIYSLWLTRDYILNDDMLLLDSDIVFDKRIIGQLISSEYASCLALRSDHVLGEEEIKVTVTPEGTINAISKTVDPKSAIGESIGIEKFDKKLVNTLFDILEDMIIAEKDVNVFYEKAFQRAIDQGAEIFPIDVGELKCMEIDTIDDYEQAKKMLSEL